MSEQYENHSFHQQLHRVTNGENFKLVARFVCPKLWGSISQLWQFCDHLTVRCNTRTHSHASSLYDKCQKANERFLNEQHSYTSSVAQTIRWQRDLSSFCVRQMVYFCVKSLNFNRFIYDEEEKEYVTILSIEKKIEITTNTLSYTAALAKPIWILLFCIVESLLSPRKLVNNIEPKYWRDARHKTTISTCLQRTDVFMYTYDKLRAIHKSEIPIGV